MYGKPIHTHTCIRKSLYHKKITTTGTNRIFTISDGTIPYVQERTKEDQQDWKHFVKIFYKTIFDPKKKVNPLLMTLKKNIFLYFCASCHYDMTESSLSSKSAVCEWVPTFEKKTISHKEKNNLLQSNLKIILPTETHT